MKEITGSITDPDSTFWEEGDDGLFRLYDMASGDVLQVLGPEALVSTMPAELAEIERADGTKVLVQKNVALDVSAVGKKGRRFSPILMDLMCQAIANGDAPLKVAEKYDVKYALLSSWKRKYPEFAERMNQALQDRADYLADRALMEAESSNETVAGVAKAKLIVETLWRSAEVANQKKYSPKVKVEGQINTAVQIVIETGFRDRAPGNFNIDETAKLREEIKAPSVAIEGAKSEISASLDPNGKAEINKG